MKQITTNWFEDNFRAKFVLGANSQTMLARSLESHIPAQMSKLWSNSFRTHAVRLMTQIFGI